jgi:hypothetical protein
LIGRSGEKRLFPLAGKITLKDQENGVFSLEKIQGAED